MTAPTGTALAGSWVPDHIVAENVHGVYCVPSASRHRPASRTILASKVWEVHTIELLRHAEPAGDIVHAGAFFGDFIPALAHSRRDGALVWAFEPGRENHRCAGMTTFLNDLDNVALFHAGLDEMAGTGTLVTRNFSGVPLGGASRIVEGEDPNGSALGGEDVDLVAIDEVVGGGRRVAAIQLDVEGRERQALSGAMRTIERCRPLLIAEGFLEPAWIASVLAPLGYAEEQPVSGNSVLRSSVGSQA